MDGGTITRLSTRYGLTPRGTPSPLLMNGLIISCVSDRCRIAETGGSATPVGGQNGARPAKPHTPGNAFNRFRRRWSQQVPDFLEFCLNLFPGRIWAITKQLALRLVFAADRIVIFLYGGVFTGFQHGDDFRLRRQLKQVVIVPRIGSERRLVALEQFHLAVDGEHFLDEGPPEMQQAQGKASLVVRAQ